LVYRCKIIHVLEKHGCFHCFRQVCSRLGEDCLEVLKNLLGLVGGITAYELIGLGVYGQLSAGKNEWTCNDSLAVGTIAAGALSVLTWVFFS
jgi:hypothetical protein